MAYTGLLASQIEIKALIRFSQRTASNGEKDHMLSKGHLHGQRHAATKKPFRATNSKIGIHFYQWVLSLFSVTDGPCY
jgi:hypothetical protein